MLGLLIAGFGLALPFPGAAGQCNTASHRAFDFLVGSWAIRNAAGELVGTNTATVEMAGCVIHEVYHGSLGTVGESFSTWDESNGVWHQTWVDNEGSLLVLQGDVGEHGAMELVGEDAGQWTRFIWTPTAEGAIRQTAERAATATGPWETSFSSTWTRIGTTGVDGGGQMGLSEAMAPLRGLLGVWSITPIQERDGEWVRLPSLPAEFKPTLDGRGIVAEPTHLLGAGWVSSIETYSWDPFQEIYRLGWHDSLAGLLDIYEGRIEGSVLRLDNLESATFWGGNAGETYAFRLEYDLAPVDGVREARVFISSDSGESWTLYQRTEYRALGSE